MHQLSPAQWLARVPTVAALTVSPQTATVPSMSIQSTAPSFRSVIQDYRPYNEEKTIDSKQANENVGKIGGWREYAREASQPDTAIVFQVKDPQLLRSVKAGDKVRFQAEKFSGSMVVTEIQPAK